MNQLVSKYMKLKSIVEAIMHINSKTVMMKILNYLILKSIQNIFELYIYSILIVNTYFLLIKEI